MARALSLADLPDAVARGIRLGPDSPLRKKARGPRRDDEHREQVALFDWARRSEHRIPELRWLFAVPNWIGVGTARHGARLKAEGRKPGVLDVWLPVVRWRIEYSTAPVAVGCAIEMKAGRNRMTDEQTEWFAHLASQGWDVHVCYSAAEARAALCAYLGVDDPEPETLEGAG